MHDFHVYICKVELGNWRLKVYTLTHIHEFPYMGMYKYVRIFVLVQVTFEIARDQFLNPT
jgi:hypothetical protein